MAINNEVKLSEQDVIISRADANGIVTYINEAFTRISGFTKEDIIGKSHNLVNHSYMPKIIFGDFWKTIKANKKWSGVIKNKTKDGGFYWVKAYVSAIKKDASGNPIEFSSIRVKPTDEEVRQAEKIYESINLGEKKYKIKEGIIYKKSITGLIKSFNPFSITNKILGLNIIGSSIIIGTISLGYLMSHDTKKTLDFIYTANQNFISDLIVIEDRLRRGSSDILYNINNSSTEEHEELNKHLKNIKELTDNNQVEEAREYVDNNRDVIKALVVDAIDDYMSQIEGSVDSAEHLQNYIRLLLLIAGLFGLFVLVFGSIFTIRSIKKPLKDAEENAIQVASGNLKTKNLELRNDELGNVMELINVMKKSLKSMIDSTKIGIDNIVPDIYDMNERNQSMVSRLEQQSVAVQQTASSLEEISSTVRNTTENSNQASNQSNTTLQKVSETKDIVETLNASMMNVVEQSKKMQELLKTIDTISFQTKILSINASIEGARAGEHGKGFSVVANEVRKLSTETETIAKSINDMLKKSSEAVTDAVNKTNLVIESIHEVEKQTHQVNTFNQEINIATQEQNLGIEEINRAIMELDKTIQDSANDMARYQEATDSLKNKADTITYNTKAFL